MTIEEFQFKIHTKTTIEFKLNGITYNLFYDKDSSGKDTIRFGRLYEEVTYYSLGELLNNAKIENFYFKNFIEDL